MRRFIIGFVSGCAFMLLFGFYIWHRPPLIAISAWRVSYSIGSTPHSDGAVYRTFFPSTVYFVYLPSAQEKDRWFGFSPVFRSVGSPGRPYSTLFGFSTHRAPNVGIELRDPKLEEEWRVDYSGGLPRFSSSTLSVQITE